VLAAQKPPQSTGVAAGQEHVPLAWQCESAGQQPPPDDEQSTGACAGQDCPADWAERHWPVALSHDSPSSQQPPLHAAWPAAQQRPEGVSSPSQQLPVAGSLVPEQDGSSMSLNMQMPPLSWTLPAFARQQAVLPVTLSESAT
jgi:hypothetical protein